MRGALYPLHISPWRGAYAQKQLYFGGGGRSLLELNRQEREGGHLHLIPALGMWALSRCSYSTSSWRGTYSNDSVFYPFAFAGRAWGESWETSAIIASNPAEIRIWSGTSRTKVSSLHQPAWPVFVYPVVSFFMAYLTPPSVTHAVCYITSKCTVNWLINDKWYRRKSAWSNWR